MLESIADVKSVLDDERAQRSAFAREVRLGVINSQLLEADEFVRSLLEREPGDQEAWLVSAELASRLGYWETAIARWSEVLTKFSDQQDLAHHGLAVAYRHIGSYARAWSALGAIRPGGISKSIVKEERERLRSDEDRRAGVVVARRALRGLTSGDATEGDRSALDAATHLLNLSACRAACVRATFAFASDEPTPLEGTASGTQAPTPESAPPPVFFCGFGWSGSGALFDYFRQGRHAVAPFGSAELLAFERHTSARRLLRAFRKETDEAFRATLLEFIFYSVFGFGGAPTMSANAIRNQSFLAHLPDNRRTLAHLEHASKRLFATGLDAYRRRDRSAFEEELQSFFQTIFALATPAGSVPVTNNCITAANIDTLRLVGRSTAVVVLRDPRDQYVAQRYEFRNRDRLSVDRFIRKARSRHERFERRVTSLAPVRVHRIRFEDFVLSSRERTALGENIGIPATSVPVSARYHPTHSLHNVGIHRTYAEQSEIRKIEDELGDLLFTP